MPCADNPTDEYGRPDATDCYPRASDIVMEKLLRENKRLTELNEAKDKFIDQLMKQVPS